MVASDEGDGCVSFAHQCVPAIKKKHTSTAEHLHSHLSTESGAPVYIVDRLRQ